MRRFPAEDVRFRLTGAVLAAPHDEWQLWPIDDRGPNSIVLTMRANR